ncbi:MAG: integrase, partial [Bacteroidota bacterium]
MFCDRVVVPTTLRATVLDTLHSAHQGVASMQLRAQAIIFWPGITNDIIRVRERCDECNKNSPSQASLPSEPAACPNTPFQHIFADFFEFGGRKYLVIGDRLSGFSEVFFTPTGTSSSGASGLIVCLRKLFQTFGVPEELSSDGGPEFTADSTQRFLRTWNVSHRVSSAYHPKSNGRAEVAVKTVKRLMRANVGASGRLHTDRFLRAMLQLRNTPDPDCGVSP